MVKPWQRFYPEGISTEYVPPRISVPEMISSIVREHAQRDALIYRDRRISYVELGRNIAMISNGLSARGIGPGQTVGIYQLNSPFHPYFFFGILGTGARVTHLSPLDAPRELAFKCRDSQVRMLVTLNIPAMVARAMALKAEGVVAEVVICDEDEVFGRVPGVPLAPAIPEDAIPFADIVKGQDTVLERALKAIDPAEIALFQYTGGTTGLPKAVMLSHANFTASIGIYTTWLKNEPHTRPGTVTLAVLPLFHIMALVSIMMRRFKEGGTIILHQRFELEKVLEAIEKYRVSSLSGVPTNWIAIANYPEIGKRDLTSLEIISSGGAPLPVEIHSRINELTGLKLRGGWGMTETCSAGTGIPPGLPDEKIGTIGVPLPGVDVAIVSLDDPHRILPPGETGEIRVKSPSVTSGYWNRPEETASAFIDDYLLTGDIGYMDADGFVYLVDRKKDLIISSGYNVYPQPIEDAIIEHPDVAEVMVIGIPDSYRGEAAKAFIVLRSGAREFTCEELRAFLADKLGKHELPQEIAFRTELPKTSVGKYSRKLLRDQELGHAGRSQHAD